eukprot:UN09874
MEQMLLVPHFLKISSPQIRNTLIQRLKKSHRKYDDMILVVFHVIGIGTRVDMIMKKNMWRTIDIGRRYLLKFLHGWIFCCCFCLFQYAYVDDTLSKLRLLCVIQI